MMKIIRDINIPAFVVLVIYPLLLVALTVHYVHDYGVTKQEIWTCIIAYYVCNISVGVGLHRLWSHNAFKTNKFVELILMFTTAATFQGPVLSWASNHYRHHTFTDKEQDPHSPLKFENRFLGFFWSHIGWMLVGEGSHKSIDKGTMKTLGTNPILRFQLQYYWQLACFMNFVLPPMIGYYMYGTLHGAYSTFLFIAIARALQQQATFCINSLFHFVGQPNYTANSSKDSFWFAPFVLGENWHNFHHAFPRDYRNGHKWYHFDAHKWIIWCMSKVGLAWDLDITPEYRIEAKKKETALILAKNKLSGVSFVQEKILEISASWQKHCAELEEFANNSQEKLSGIIAEIQNGINVLSLQIKELSNESSEKMIRSMTKKLRDMEDSMNALYEKVGISSAAFTREVCAVAGKKTAGVTKKPI